LNSHTSFSAPFDDSTAPIPIEKSDKISDDLARMGSMKKELQKSLRRDHRQALRDGSPPVPSGYYWSTKHDEGRNLFCEVPSDGNELKTRYVGILLNNGEWEPIAGEAFNPLDSTTFPASATGSKGRITQPLATGSTKGLQSPKKAKASPPKPAGCYWVAEGKGWKLMRSKRDNKNQNPRIGHLSATAWKQIKAAHKSKEDRATALTAWAKAKAQQKGIEL